MSREWIPNYIRQNMQYKPKDILTAQDYNAILNLLITQGDYNSEWLEYLQTEGVPEMILDIGMEQIQLVLTAAVRAEIDSLAASVVNKTSRQLNEPNITILNIGQQISGIAELNTLIASKNLKATYAVATNLIGFSSTYPTLVQLNTLKEAGNNIVAYSTDGAAIPASLVVERATIAKEYMAANGFNSNIFVYPMGTITDHTTTAGKAIIEDLLSVYDFAVNPNYSNIITPDGFMRSDALKLGDVPVIPFSIDSDIDAIKDGIDDIVLNNKYMIIMVDTDAQYNPEGLETILDYTLTKNTLVYPSSIDSVTREITDTIGNLLHDISGVYITKDTNNKTVLNW